MRGPDVASSPQAVLMVGCLMVLQFCVSSSIAFVDPLSAAGLVAGGVGLAMSLSSRMRDLTVCRLTECCTDRHIPADIEGELVVLKK